MDLGLQGKRAFVTGASRGIGKAIALALAKEGCQVAICARTSLPLEQTLAELSENQEGCLSLRVDVTDERQIQQAWERLMDRWGGLDILVNNVGGGGERIVGKVEEYPEERWMNAYALNALPALRFSLKAIPLMKKQRWGRVVTIASIQGREGTGRPWYAVAKSAEITLMKTLARNTDFARNGITFNSIAPGTILSDENDWGLFRRETPEKYLAVIGEKCPMGRPGQPAEIGSVAAFVCSDLASYLNGACLVVDGGESRCL